MQAAISVFGDKKHGFWGEESEHCGGRTCTRTMRPKVSFSPSSPAGEALFQRLRNQEAENKDLRKQVRRLEKKADRLSKNIADMAAKISHLEDRLEQAHRLLSGKKSERYTPADNAQQGQLSGEEPEAVEPEEEEEYVPVKRKRRGKNKPVRGPILDHLPREVIRLEPEGSTAGMKYIGEEVTEYLEYVPGFTRVVRIVRPKYVVCKEPRKGVVIAPLPKRVIPKGKAGPGLLAYLAVAKYVDHMPLYRLRKKFQRHGVKLSAATMGDWIAKVATYLGPLGDALRKEVLRSGYLQVDETTFPVQKPKKKGKEKEGRKNEGKTHRGYLWVYLAPRAKVVMMDYSPSRARAGPWEFLRGYRGAMQTDGYVVYDAFGTRGGITLFGCMAHARRKFFDCRKKEPKKVRHVMEEIRQLYAIERGLRKEGAGPARRVEVRQEEARPVLEKLKPWLEESREHRPSAGWDEAVGYMLNRWEKLVCYLEDGKVEIDNNLVENQMRAIALGRKNHLFAGSHAAAQRSAVLYSLFATCKLQSTNPIEWLTDVLRRLPTHPADRMAELLPHHWKASRDLQQATVKKAA